MSKQHNSHISAVKGVCIILMVVGHAGAPDCLNHALALFRMPLFFLASGYFFKEKNLATPRQFAWRRIKGLYWPFAKWTLIFALLHNVFARLHCYRDTYSLPQLAERIVRGFTLTGSEQLLGGYWFLKELLFSSLMVFATLLLLNRRFHLHNVSNSGGGKLLIAYYLVSFVYSLFPIDLPCITSGTFMAAGFYVSGMVYARSPLATAPRPWLGALCLAALFLVSTVFHTGMSVKGWRVLPYVATGLLGSFAITNLTALARGRVLQALDYVGSRTLYILTFHFSAFKLVSLLKVKIYGLPLDDIASFPVIRDHNTWWWLAYTLVGVIVPLCIHSAVKRGERAFHSVTKKGRRAWGVTR